MRQLSVGGLWTWLASVRRVARIHRVLTREGYRVRMVRPTKDGGYITVIGIDAWQSADEVLDKVKALAFDHRGVLGDVGQISHRDRYVTLSGA